MRLDSSLVSHWTVRPFRPQLSSPQCPLAILCVSSDGLLHFGSSHTRRPFVHLFPFAPIRSLARTGRRCISVIASLTSWSTCILVAQPTPRRTSLNLDTKRVVLGSVYQLSIPRLILSCHQAVGPIPGNDGAICRPSKSIPCPAIQVCQFSFLPALFSFNVSYRGHRFIVIFVYPPSHWRPFGLYVSVFNSLSFVLTTQKPTGNRVSMRSTTTAESRENIALYGLVTPSISFCLPERTRLGHPLATSSQPTSQAPLHSHSDRCFVLIFLLSLPRYECLG